MIDPHGIEYGHYSMTLEWEPIGAVYVITVPELPGCRTHGVTPKEAVANVLDVIELWIDDARASGEPLPVPRWFSSTRDGVGVAAGEVARVS